MKKRTVMMWPIIITTIILLGALVFIILSKPERVLRREIGIEPSERIVLSKVARDIDGIWVRYSYELVFDIGEYEEVIRELCNFCGRSTEKETEYEYTNIKWMIENGNGFPHNKDWFSPENESVVWVHDSQCFKVLISQDSEGKRHAYINYDWSPFHSTIH